MSAVDTSRGRNSSLSSHSSESTSSQVNLQGMRRQYSDWTKIYKNRLGEPGSWGFRTKKEICKAKACFYSVYFWGCRNSFFCKMDIEVNKQNNLSQERKLDHYTVKFFRALQDMQQHFLKGESLLPNQSDPLSQALQEMLKIFPGTRVSRRNDYLLELFERTTLFPQSRGHTTIYEKEIRQLAKERSEGVAALDKLYGGESLTEDERESALALYCRKGAFYLGGKAILYPDVLKEYQMSKERNTPPPQEEEKYTMVSPQSSARSLSSVFQFQESFPIGSLLKGVTAIPRPSFESLANLYRDEDVKDVPFSVFLAVVSVGVLAYNFDILEVSERVKKYLAGLFLGTEGELIRSDLLGASSSQLHENRMVAPESKRILLALCLYSKYQRGLSDLQNNPLLDTFKKKPDSRSFVEDELLPEPPEDSLLLELLVLHANKDSLSRDLSEFPSENESVISRLSLLSRFVHIYPQIRTIFRTSPDQIHSIFLFLCSQGDLFNDNFCHIFSSVLDCIPHFSLDPSISFLQESLKAYFAFIRHCLKDHSEFLLLIILTRNTKTPTEIFPTKDTANKFIEALNVFSVVMGGKKHQKFPSFTDRLFSAELDPSELRNLIDPDAYELILFLGTTANGILQRFLEKVSEIEDCKMFSDQVLRFYHLNQEGNLEEFGSFCHRLLSNISDAIGKEQFFVDLPILPHFESIDLEDIQQRAKSILQLKDFTLPEKWLLFRLSLGCSDPFSLICQIRDTLGSKRRNPGESKTLLPISPELVSALEEDDYKRVKQLRSLTEAQTGILKQSFRGVRQNILLSDSTLVWLYLRGAQFVVEKRTFLLQCLALSFEKLEKFNFPPRTVKNLIESPVFLYLILLPDMSEEFILRMLSNPEIDESEIEKFFHIRAAICGDTIREEDGSVIWYDPRVKEKEPPILSIKQADQRAMLDELASEYIKGINLEGDDAETLRVQWRTGFVLGAYPFSQQFNEAVCRVRRIEENGFLQWTESVFATKEGMEKSIFLKSPTKLYCHWIKSIEGSPYLFFAFSSWRGSSSCLLNLKAAVEALGEESFLKYLRNTLPLFLDPNEDDVTDLSILQERDTFFFPEKDSEGLKPDLFLFLRTMFPSSLSLIREDQHLARIAWLDRKGKMESAFISVDVDLEESKIETARIAILSGKKDLYFAKFYIENISIFDHIEREATMTLLAAQSRNRQLSPVKKAFRTRPNSPRQENTADRTLFNKYESNLREARDQLDSQQFLEIQEEDLERDKEMRESIRRAKIGTANSRFITIYQGTVRIPMQYSQEEIENSQLFERKFRRQCRFMKTTEKMFEIEHSFTKPRDDDEKFWSREDV